jgi:hypothetical protein
VVLKQIVMLGSIKIPVFSREPISFLYRRHASRYLPRADVVPHPPDRVLHQVFDAQDSGYRLSAGDMQSTYVCALLRPNPKPAPLRLRLV